MMEEAAIARPINASVNQLSLGQSEGSGGGADLVLGGDVQVLQAAVKQQVLVDLVPGDHHAAVHLGVGGQVHLQHLETHAHTHTHRQLLAH